MNPLSSLALLPANINHQHFMISELEDGLGNADCSCSTTNDVLLGWDVVDGEKPFQVRVEVRQAVKGVVRIISTAIRRRDRTFLAGRLRSLAPKPSAPLGLPIVTAGGP